jgi:hypothetical protein
MNRIKALALGLWDKRGNQGKTSLDSSSTARAHESTGEEQLVNDCVERLTLACGHNEVELWESCHHPESLAMIKEIGEGVVYQWYLQRQMQESLHPRLPFATLRTANPDEVALFRAPRPTHVAEFEFIPYPEVTKAKEERRVEVWKLFLILTKTKGSIAIPIPSNDDVDSMRAYLEALSDERRRAADYASTLSAETRDEILAFQIEGRRISAVAFLKEQTQLPLSVCRDVVDHVWAVRPLS